MEELEFLSEAEELKLTAFVVSEIWLQCVWQAGNKAKICLNDLPNAHAIVLLI